MKDIVAVGKVTTIYPDRCTAKVYFEDTKSVSRELSVLTRGSQGTKDYWMPEVNEEVVCIFVPNSRGQGYILGTEYNEEDTPPVASKDKRHIQFNDLSFFEYDSKNHTLTFDFSKVSGAKVIFKNCTVLNE